jgi:hypothetical protein
MRRNREPTVRQRADCPRFEMGPRITGLGTAAGCILALRMESSPRLARRHGAAGEPALLRVAWQQSRLRLGEARARRRWALCGRGYVSATAEFEQALAASGRRSFVDASAAQPLSRSFDEVLVAASGRALPDAHWPGADRIWPRPKSPRTRSVARFCCRSGSRSSETLTHLKPAGRSKPKPETGNRKGSHVRPEFGKKGCRVNRFLGGGRGCPRRAGLSPVHIGISPVQSGSHHRAVWPTHRGRSKSSPTTAPVPKPGGF